MFNYISKLNAGPFLFLGSLILILQGFLLMINNGLFLIKLDLALQMALLLVFLFWAGQCTGSCVNAPALFIIAIFYWHSAFLFCHFFQISPLFEDTGRAFNYASAEIPKATAFIGICLSFMVIGTMLGYGQQRKIHEHTKSLMDKARGSSSIKIVLFVFTVYSLVTFLYLFQIGVGLFDQKYSEAFYLIQPDSFLFRLYQSTKFFSVILIITALAYTRKTGRFYILIVFLALILVQFLLGTRSMPFIMILALIVSIDHFMQRLSWKTFLILILALAFMNCVVSYSSSAVGLGWNVFNLAASGHKINLWQFIWDAQQGGVVARTMHFMSQDGHFLYGRSILDAFIYLLPRFIVDGLGFHTGFVVPSEWLVAHSGDVKSGGGLGFSLIAEAYFNFGIAGCLLFLYLGWFIGTNYFRYVFLKDPYALLHALNFSLILSLHIRNDIGSYMRYLVYGFLFIELLRIMDKRECGALTKGKTNA